MNKKVIAIIGILVLIIGLVTAGFYLAKKTTTLDIVADSKTEIKKIETKETKEKTSKLLASEELSDKSNKEENNKINEEESDKATEKISNTVNETVSNKVNGEVSNISINNANNNTNNEVNVNTSNKTNNTESTKTNNKTSNEVVYKSNVNIIDIIRKYTTYTVKHYKMNVDGRTYGEPKTEIKIGTINTSVTPKVKEYAGFTSPKTKTIKIDESGNAVVEYYYTRNKYKLEIASNKGVAEVTGEGKYYYEQEVSISAKVLEGYTFDYWIEENGNRYEKDTFKMKIGTKDTLLIGIAEAKKDTTYKIKHYKMNLDGETYADPEVYTKIGATDTSITPKVKTYEGFTSPEVKTVNIDGDGNTVVEYYYTRNKYNLELTFGTGIAEVIGSGEYYYGQEVLVSAKVFPGYTFYYWLDDDGLGKRGSELNIKIGAKDAHLKANARTNKDTLYTVKHYKMNLDGKTYAEPETETKAGTTNTAVTPEVKKYEGFTAPEVKTVNIDGDGNTVVEYYYTRNKYKLTVTGNTGISEVTGTGEYYYEEEVTVNAKVLPGYTFDYWVDDNKTEYKNIKTKITIGAKDINLTANAKANGDIAYTVKHYKMNLDGKTYAEAEIEIKSGTTNNAVTPEVKKYEGFTAPEVKTVNIDGDGNTVVEYYYTRNKYKLTVTGNTGISEVTGTGEYYYEEEVTVNAKVLPGYTFDYWVDDNKTEYKNIKTKITIGAKDINLTANAKANGDTAYTVKHYKMNLDGKTYAEAEIEIKSGTTNNAVTPEIKKYEGFTAPEAKTVNIDGDGNTVVEYYYTRNKYKLTLTGNTGISEVTGAGEYYYEEEVTISAKVLEGYTFTYWIDDNKTEYKDNKAKIKIGAKDINLTANAKKNEYVITYDANGGKTSSSEQKVLYGEKITKPNDPTYAGHTFMGWYINLEDEKAFDFNNTMPMQDFTLYAKWKANKYTVIFNANSGKGTMANQEFTYDKSDKLKANEFTRNGYTFAGWSETANGSAKYKDKAEVKNIAESGNKNLYAVWNAINYTIEYDLDGGTLNSPNKESYTIETESFKLNNPTKTDYAFKEWVLEDGTVLKDGTISKGTTGNLKLKATYTLNKKFKIIYNANNSTNETSVQEIEYNKETKLIKNTFTKSYTVTYNYNYSGKDNETIKIDSKFLGWATETNGDAVYKDEGNVKAIDINSDSINLYAKWENPTITLKEVTRDNYKFIGWSTSADKSGIISSKDYTLTKNIKLTAIWEDKAPRIESIAFTVKDSSGKIYNEAVGMGDNAFYLKFPAGSSFDISSLKIKTNMPINLNTNAIEDPNYTDIKASTVSDDGKSGKIKLGTGFISYSMNVSTSDKMNWSVSGTSRYVNIEQFKSILSFIGNGDLGIAKGFGISEEGLETPHYISTMSGIQGETYMFFKEEGTPDITVKFVNGAKEQLSFSIPKGSSVPKIEPYNVAGQNFDNWYTDEELSTTFNFDKPIYSDTTIYAKYTVKKEVDTSWYENNKDAEVYNISTLEELKGFAYLSSLSDTDHFSEKTINLMSDIDLKNEAWTPITDFYGIFNGNNHTISNLKITDSIIKMDGGFFGGIIGAKISNLKIENVNINLPNCSYVGTVVGYCSRSTIEKVSVNNISITGKATVGGIVGNGYGGKISECSSTNGQVHADYRAGGIVAQEGGEVELTNLYSDVTVKADNSHSLISQVGGILGEYSVYQSNNNLTMQNVLFTGKVISTSEYTGAIYGFIGVTSYTDDDTSYDNDKTGSKNTWLYDKNKIGLTNSDYLNRGIPKTTNELKKASTYSSWNKNIWNIADGAYPTLKWLK